MIGLHEAQIASRSRMYINSGREAFERANMRAHGILKLPEYPGGGTTACRTNCKCFWDIQEVHDDEGNLIGWDCYWTLTDAEHCDDCITYAETKYAPWHVEA